MKTQFNKEKAKRNLKEIFDKMHTAGDITLLQDYHKLYKKEVSLFKRSWAAAWLFMYYDQRETPSQILSTPGEEKRQQFKGKISKITEEKSAVEITLNDEESRRLFFSIGKNRKLFPREIITLIMAKTSSAREDIGAIRILDNYSFVQVRDTKADEIIQALTGHRFRGRTLTVNYAKPKTGDNDEN